MKLCRSQRRAAVLLICVTGGLIWGCSGRKQVPFGLKDAGGDSSEPATGVEEEAPELPVGESFGPDQVEVRVAESTLVLKAGYALAALQLNLDGIEPDDAFVVSADPQQVRLTAAYPRGLDVSSRAIDSFLVPQTCVEPTASIRQLSSSLVAARVEHRCETGKRTNLWLITIEAQPRVRERITVLPQNEVSNADIAIELAVEDRDADGYEDVVANLRIGQTDVPLAWLDRPGGFARDVSEPEARLKELADGAWESFSSNPKSANTRAIAVLDSFVALCRESGAARVGLSGTQGLQCQQSPATARAASVAISASIRRGNFVRALELQRWWQNPALQPSPEERNLVQAAWRKAKANAVASWRTIDSEGGRASLYFRDADTLVIDGRAPRQVQLSSGIKTQLSEAELVPAIRDPTNRFAVRDVRATCAGFEAEVGPIRGRQSHRVPIERRSSKAPCGTPIDRPASVFEWAVLGWAPQGLVGASGDLLRVVPLNQFAKPAGRPIDLGTTSPLPAPIRGARITTDGTRYVIPH
ncbi:MAG: hypothetical protein HKN10_02090, partial [Myxococcales bacterium]|nr:hypothetical protein [Myxococcales bacterium]